MEIDAVQDSFRLYFHRGRIPFSLIYKPLKFKCLNEMIVQILTDWVRACDAGAMWDEKINNPVTPIGFVTLSHTMCEDRSVCYQHVAFEDNIEGEFIREIGNVKHMCRMRSSSTG